MNILIGIVGIAMIFFIASRLDLDNHKGELGAFGIFILAFILFAVVL